MPPSTPLFDPSGYFRERTRPLKPGAAVFVAMFVAAMALFVFTLELVVARMDGAPPGVRGEIYGRILPVVLVSLVVFAIAWVVVAAVMHLLGGFGTDGRFADALGVAGWAYAPELVTSPIGAALVYLEMRSRTFDATDPSRFAAEVEQFQAGGTSLPGILLLAFVTGWSVYILANGIRETHDAPAETAWLAAIVVGIGSFILGLAGA